jgi:hypothetical protein
MVYKKGPLCSPCSAFGLESAELLLVCLINLLPESFGAPSLCLRNPTTFLEYSSRIQSSVFTSLLLAQCPWPTKRADLPGATRPCWSKGREPLSQRTEKLSFSHTKDPKSLRNQIGNSTHQIGKNPGPNSGLPQEAEGESNQLPAETP